MKRSTLLALGLGLSVLPSSAARAAEGESSFTPTSFIMPIYSIMLARGLTTNVPLYTCTPGTTTDAGVIRDCLVDMADAGALESLFSQAVDIPAGTYDRIVVMPCTDSSGFQARLRGSVELEGVTYYTTGADPVLSTNPADLGYASIDYAGCGNTIQLPRELTIAAGDEITVSAFFTLKDLSWVLRNNSPGLGGCAEAPPGESNVCSGLPVLVAYLGAVAPALDAYYISEDPSDLLATKAAGQVLLLSSDGEPFSGFLRRVYSHDSVTPSVSYDVPLREITKNNPSDPSDAGSPALDAALPSDAAVSSDAAVVAEALASYDIHAIGDPARDVTKYRARFPRFELRDHAGTLFTANGASQVPYRAVRR